MKTDSIARHYDVLTSRERLPLIVSAFFRDDIAEVGRLVLSAPHVPALVGSIDRLNQLVNQYLIDQLTVIANYWWIIPFLVEETQSGEKTRAGQQLDRLGKARRMLAYQCVTRADGWQLFCADLHLDADALLRERTGYAIVRRMEEASRILAFSAKDAADFAAESAPADDDDHAERDSVSVDTAVGIAEAMQQFLEEGSFD